MDKVLALSLGRAPVSFLFRLLSTELSFPNQTLFHQLCFQSPLLSSHKGGSVESRTVCMDCLLLLPLKRKNGE